MVNLGPLPVSPNPIFVPRVGVLAETEQEAFLFVFELAVHGVLPNPPPYPHTYGLLTPRWRNVYGSFAAWYVDEGLMSQRETWQLNLQHLLVDGGLIITFDRTKLRGPGNYPKPWFAREGELGGVVPP